MILLACSFILVCVKMRSTGNRADSFASGSVKISCENILNLFKISDILEDHTNKIYHFYRLFFCVYLFLISKKGLNRNKTKEQQQTPWVGL